MTMPKLKIATSIIDKSEKVEQVVILKNEG